MPRAHPGGIKFNSAGGGTRASVFPGNIQVIRDIANAANLCSKGTPIMSMWCRHNSQMLSLNHNIS